MVIASSNEPVYEYVIPDETDYQETRDNQSARFLSQTNVPLLSKCFGLTSSIL
jgi:hypothetical protein